MIKSNSLKRYFEFSSKSQKQCANHFLSTFQSVNVQNLLPLDGSRQNSFFSYLTLVYTKVNIKSLFSYFDVPNILMSRPEQTSRVGKMEKNAILLKVVLEGWAVTAQPSRTTLILLTYLLSTVFS